jgi:hypothetical protein
MVVVVVVVVVGAVGVVALVVVAVVAVVGGVVVVVVVVSGVVVVAAAGAIVVIVAALVVVGGVVVVVVVPVAKLGWHEEMYMMLGAGRRDCHDLYARILDGLYTVLHAMVVMRVHVKFEVVIVGVGLVSEGGSDE